MVCSPAVVPGQELSPYAKMFDKQKVDFGVVARGADTKYRLKLTNKYKENVHISNVRTTCGCSAASPTATTLRSGEEAYIEITMNTTRFSRRKESNVIVTFDAPQFAEVRIPITAYIRTDVVLTPGSAKMGAVPQGEVATKKIDVAYAGRNDWKIKEIKSPNDLISADFAETRREGGRVDYQILVKLSDKAPPGLMREQLTIVTDDANSPEVPLLFEARVESEFTVTPTVKALGRVNAGQSESFNVVVRGRRNFAVESVTCESGYEAFKVNLSNSSKAVHVFQIALTIPGKPGDFEDNFLIHIAGVDEPVKMRVYGEIVE